LKLHNQADEWLEERLEVEQEGEAKAFLKTKQTKQPTNVEMEWYHRVKSMGGSLVGRW